MSISFKSQTPKIVLNLGGEAEITFTTSKSTIQEFSSLKSPILNIEVKEFHQHKTKSQNAYLWALLEKLAIKYGDTTQNIYKSFIEDYGVKDYILIQDKAVDKFIRLWEGKGIGFLAKTFRKGKIGDTTTIQVIYGSSTYDSVEMARLINPVIEECEKVGIPTLTKEQYLKLTNENDKGE